MKTLAFTFRFVLAIALLCVTGFCVFGFLASFEVSAINSWHFLYGSCGVGSLLLAMSLLPFRAAASRSVLIAKLATAAVGLFSVAVLLLHVWAARN